MTIYRRKYDPEDPDVEKSHYAPMRKTDHKKLAKISYIYDLLRPFLAIGIGFLLALGFDFKLPKQKFAELQSQIDVIRKDVNAGTDDRREIKDLLVKQLKLLCLDKIQNKQQTALQLVGIDCTQIMNSSPLIK